MRTTLIIPLLLLCACTEEPAAAAPVHPVLQELMFVDVAETDSITVNGICSLREAWRVIANGVPSADCGVDDGSHTITLSAGTWTLAVPNPSPVQTEDTQSAVGDLDITGTGSITIQGAGVGLTVLDGASLDRIIHAKGNSSVSLLGLTLRNGCVNGGNCTTATAGSEPIGGLVYANNHGLFAVDDTRWENGRARSGGCLGICSALDSAGLIEDSVFTGCEASVGGGAIQSHTTWTGTRLQMTGNRTTGPAGIGGAVQQYDRTASFVDSTCTGNTAAIGGCLAAVGRWEATTAGRVDWMGGTLGQNTATVKAGNVFVGAVGPAGSTAAPYHGVPCSTAGCRADVRGALAVAGGAAPAAPDCSGTVDTWNGATVANPSGCTVVPHGPVCGNGITEAGEFCDYADPAMQCCNAVCGSALEATPCSDGDECTAGDVCDAYGECISGSSSSCGDGVLQPGCGEQCDDGNNESCDGCSVVCVSEAPIYCAP